MQGKCALSQQLVMSQLVMNSSQRRLAERKFPCTISIFATTYQTYYTYDDKIKDAREWCQKFLNGKHRVITGWDHAEFKFTTEKDAIIFALNWL